MEKLLLSIIAASGLCAASSHVGRQYHFVHDENNMTEALSYCRHTYTGLATVDSREDMELLNNMADVSAAWIGLYDDLDSWRWSLSDQGFYRPGEMEFRNWFSGEPNNQESGETCAQMFDNGQWNDKRCDELRQAVCFDARGPTFVLTNYMTWTEAQSYCRAQHTDLLSVRNMTENQAVRELVPAQQSVWIGLFRDSWKWSDGSTSTFRNWRVESELHISEPNNLVSNEACVKANFMESGKWEDWPCDGKEAFICYSQHDVRTKQVMKLRLLKKNSSLDLNEPAVMAEILNQLRQRLEDQQVDGGITLSWKKQSDGKVFLKDEKERKKRNANTK